MTNFCIECGSALSGGKFCSECGHPVSQTSALPTPDRQSHSWPCQGGSSSNSNFANEEDRLDRENLSGIEQQWHFACVRGIPGQPIVVEDSVVFGMPSAHQNANGTSSAILYCIDRWSGALKWLNQETGHYNSNEGDLIGSPAFYLGWLYCQFDVSPMWAIDLATGSDRNAVLLPGCDQRWIDEPPRPTIHRGLLYHANDQGVIAYPVEELRRRAQEHSGEYWDWISSHTLYRGAYVMGSIAVDEGLVCAITNDGALIGPEGHAFEQASFIEFPPEMLIARGDEPGKADWNDFSSNGVAVASGFGVSTLRLWCIDDESNKAWYIISYDLHSRSVAWFHTLGSKPISDCAVGHGNAIYGDSQGIVRCLDLATGNEKWQVRPGGARPISARPLIVNELVLIGNAAGELYALDAMSGETVRKWVLPGAVTGSPAVTERWLYIPTQNGLVALH